MGGGISKNNSQDDQNQESNSQEDPATKVKERYEEYRDHQFVILVHEKIPEQLEEENKPNEFKEDEEKEETK